MVGLFFVAAIVIMVTFVVEIIS